MSKKDNLLLKDAPLQEQVLSQSTPKNEIDLIVLTAKIYKIIVKNLRVFYIILILSLITSTLGYFLFKPVYTANLVASSREINFLVLNLLINNLEDLIEEENYKELSKKLSISESEAEDIWSLSTIDLLEGQKEIERERIYRDPEIKYQYFVIKAKLRDNKLFPKIQKGLVDYLENHEYVSKRTGIYLKNKEQLMNTIKKERQGMDTLKRNLENGLLYSSKKELSIIDPAELYEKYVKLKEDELDLQKDLELFQDIQVIEGFTKYEKPTSFNFSKSTAAGILGAIFIWILYIIFSEIRRLVQKVEV